MDLINYLNGKGILQSIAVQNVDLTDVADTEDAIAISVYDSSSNLIFSAPVIDGNLFQFFQFFEGNQVQLGDIYYLQKRVIREHENGVKDIDAEYQKLMFIRTGIE